MKTRVPTPPTTFDVSPFAGRWFSWADIAACFWPGRGGRSMKVNPTLAPVCSCGGVYLLAWSKSAPKLIQPSVSAIHYIGQTNLFKRRMEQFGWSAGFWGERASGHSAGWRWPQGQHAQLLVAFFEMGCDLPIHLADGLRAWMEGVALEEYFQANGRLPIINEEELEDFGTTG